MRGNVLYDLGTLIYGIGGLAGLIFVLHYGLSAPWWKSAVGRMFIVIGAAIVFAQVTLLYQIGKGAFIGRPLPALTVGDLVLRLIGYCLFALAMGFLLGTYLHERRKPSSLLPTRKDSMSTTPTPAPPAIWYPWQRVIRTILAAIVVLVPILNATLPLVASAFEADGVPPAVFLTVNGIVAGCLVVLGVVSRLMAIPVVNDFLTKLGAGSVPKTALTPAGHVRKPEEKSGLP